MTLDDFTGFSGRVLDHQWKFLGWKPILHVMNSQHPYARFYGPNGWLPNDLVGDSVHVPCSDTC